MAVRPMEVRPMGGLYYGVGQWNAGWYILLTISLAFVALGVFAYATQLVQGEVVTGLRDIGTMGGATWGLYITFVIYFGGVSFAAITMVALIRLFNLEALRPISRMAQLLAVIAIILSALSVFVDLGQPLRGLVNLLRYARPMSPFFGTFALVISGYFFASLVYLYLGGRRDAAICAQRGQGVLAGFCRLWAAGYRDTPAERQRHERATFWLAVAMVPLLVTAASTLGVVFGLQVGRPGWFGAFQAPSFVILGGVSGIGHLIVIAAMFRWLLGEREQLNLKLFRWLGNILMVLTILYLYFMAVEWLTFTYGAHHHEMRVTSSFLVGVYAPIFWMSVAALVVPFVLLFLQFLSGRYSVGLVVLAGVIVNLAAIGKRYLIVVPSQTHGTLLPYGTGFYSPTWVEYSVILGLLGLGAFFYILFMKVFPIMEIPEPARGGR